MVVDIIDVKNAIVSNCTVTLKKKSPKDNFIYMWAVLGTPEAVQ